MFTYIKDKWPLWLILALFIVLKLPHIFYPHYWDEAWSYAPAISLMYKHGPTLLPGVIDVEASRGHPLFFYASAATWMHLFGSSVLVKHCFALFVSVLQLAAVYLVAEKIFNKRVAITATLLLAAQVMFYVQAAMVLPEILVALLAFVSVYYYIQRRYWLTFISLSLLFLTKESGMILGFVLGIDAFVRLFSKKLPVKQLLFSLGSIAGAVAVIGCFFLYQHHVYGWFFFPGHTGLIDTSWGYVYPHVKDCIDILFMIDKAYRMYGLLLALSVVIAIWKRQWAWLLYLPAFGIFYLFYNGKAQLIGEKLMLGLAVAAFLTIIFTTRHFCKDEAAKRLVMLGGLFVAGYICFCSFNFFTQRYLLAALVWTILLAAVWLDAILSRTTLKLYIPVALLLAINLFKAYQYSTGFGDCSMNSFQAMRVQESVIGYFEKLGVYDAHIATGAYQQNQNLSKPEIGLLHKGKPFTNVKWDIDSQTDIALFDNIEPDQRYENIKNDTAFVRIQTIKRDDIWSEVYCRRSFYPVIEKAAGQ